MKRFSYYTLLLFTLLLLCVTACEDKDDVLSSFQIVKTTIDSDPAALRGEIELSDANFTYEVSGGDWCNVTKDGKVLTLKGGANYDFQNRTVEVVILVGKKKYRVPVTQNGIVFELTDKTRYHFNCGLDGGERIVEFLTNVIYDVVIPETFEDWISVVDLGNNSHTIVVGTSTERRNGEVIFKYLEKTVTVTISQFEYMKYTDLLGAATISYYADSLCQERVETAIVLEEREYNHSYTLRGTFASGIEREIPLYYLESSGNYFGEIRFSPAIMQSSYEDPKSTAVKTLCCFIYAQDFINVTGLPTANPYTPQTTSKYYPSSLYLEENGTRYKFYHSLVGIGSPVAGRTRDTKGMIIAGGNALGARVTNIAIYDFIFDIEIFKE